MSILPLSEVKARLSEIADEVDRTHERVHVTRNGHEYVVLLSASDLHSLEATLELLSDNAAMSRIQQADADIAAGHLSPIDELDDVMRQRSKNVKRAD